MMTSMTWHTVTQLAPDLYRISEPLGKVEPRYGALATVNMYLVVGRDRAALIDSGMGIGDLARLVGVLTDLPLVVLNSHYHWDHAGANAQFDHCAMHHADLALWRAGHDLSDLRAAMQRPGAQAVLPAGFVPATYDIPVTPIRQVLDEGDVIDLGGRTLRVLHTPGHAPGHVVFVDEANGLLFSADVAYRGPMFVCFPECVVADFVASTRRVAGLRNSVRLICPGHGEPIDDADWLLSVADGAARAATGEVPVSRVDADFIGGRQVVFDDFSLWLPMPPRATRSSSRA